MKRSLVKAGIIAGTLAVAVSAIPDSSPLSLLNFPGWAVSLRMFFASSGNSRTAILAWVVYLGINTIIWFVLIAIVMQIWQRSARARFRRAEP